MKIITTKYSSDAVKVKLLGLTIFKIKERGNFFKIYIFGIQIFIFQKPSYLNYLNKLKKKISESNNLVYINQESNSKSKILHYGTWDCQCGIAVFLKDYICGLTDIGYTNNAIMPVINEYNLNIKIAKAYIDKIIDQAKDFDIISIQHEYSFWGSQDYKGWEDLLKDSFSCKNIKLKDYACTLPLLDYFVSNLIKQNKKISIVWHTDFNMVLNDFFKTNKISNYKEIPFFRFIDNPLLNITIMNDKFLKSLSKYNIPTNNICLLELPVKKANLIANKSKDEILRLLDFERDSIILGSFGFINKHKGIEESIESLRYLPQNYKYIHMGGVHPYDTSGYINIINEKIKKYNLESRVKITGFLSDQELINYFSVLDLGLYIGNITNEFASAAINQLIVNKIPIIASSIANFNILEKHWHCIKLLQPNAKYIDIATEIINLIENETKKNNLKENCNRFCEENTFAKFAMKSIGIK